MILKNNKDNLKIVGEFGDSGSSLGNREVGKRNVDIYKKYLRKQIAQFALTVGNKRVSSSSKKRDKSKLTKAQFQDSLRFAETMKSINKSLCSCGRDTHYVNESGAVELKKSSSNKYQLKGLKSCGNNASCPVCASKLSFIRGNDLAKLIEVGKENNRSYAMIVTTIPHKPLEKLEITLQQVVDMSRYMFNDRQWKEFKKITQCRFIHGGLENMVSFKNHQIDWHPHKNYLLDFDIPLPEVFRVLGLRDDLAFRLYVSKMLVEIGQKYLKKEKIKKKLLPVKMVQTPETLVQVKGGVTCSTHFDKKYITKWGLDAEMTGGIYKEGRYEGGSFHPFGLLDMIDAENQEVGEKQRYQATMAFQEFVVASRGKQWFYFGKGAVKYYNEKYFAEIKVNPDDEALAQMADDAKLLFLFDNYSWLNFKSTPKKIYRAFSMKSDAEVIQSFLDEIEKNKSSEKWLVQVLENGLRIDYQEFEYVMDDGEFGLV